MERTTSSCKSTKWGNLKMKYDSSRTTCLQEGMHNTEQYLEKYLTKVMKIFLSVLFFLTFTLTACRGAVNSQLLTSKFKIGESFKNIFQELDELLWCTMCISNYLRALFFKHLISRIVRISIYQIFNASQIMIRHLLNQNCESWWIIWPYMKWLFMNHVCFFFAFFLKNDWFGIRWTGTRHLPWRRRVGRGSLGNELRAAQGAEALSTVGSN